MNTSTGFAEPLVATASTTPSEDLALAHAIAVYEQRSRPEDVSSLTNFLAEHPHSGWATALMTDLGSSYLHYGYFSQAITAWQQAWAEGREAKEPRAKALVDGTIGELAHLYSVLGKTDALETLFADLGSRAITGSATEAIQSAREELTLAQKDPRHLFICGPEALRLVLTAQGARLEQVSFLQWYRAGPNGTSLAEVAKLAEKAKFSHRLIFRRSGQLVPIPSVVHWRVGHYSAIVGQANGLFHVEDSIFPDRAHWMTQAAIDEEASGYFLVPGGVSDDRNWRAVGDEEAGAVWGKGPTNGTRPGGAGDPLANKPCGAVPLCGYNIAESSVSLRLSDTPVGYAPRIGPSAKVTITYNQREDSQPQNFGFFNVSPKWTLNWLNYVTDDPNNAGANVSRHLAEGGAFYYQGYNSGTGSFTAQDDDGSVLVLASKNPVTYQRRLQDGSIEVYAQSDSSAGFPRNIFLSQVIDAQGNALSLNYDGQQRLLSLTDAVGRHTTFAYGLTNQPLLITQIADPFGRTAKFTYDSNGRLNSITDIIGLTSSFTYDGNSLVNSLTTPYGVTTFAYTAPGTSASPRFVEITDPLGYHEREEWLEPAPIPDSDPAATVPQGMPISLTNQYLTYRDSFHWDKNAYIAAGCTPSGGCDYTKARDSHFLHINQTTTKATVVESIKSPLEGRIWYTYPGQSSSIYTGTFGQPSAAARVLDDGTTQLTRSSYDSDGLFKPTETTDAVGRTTVLTYAANHIDLLAVAQKTALSLTTVAQFTFNGQHRPLVFTDAAGQSTRFAYNAAGQLSSVTNALGETTTFQHDPVGNLTTIVNANGATAATFTYDAYARVRTTTDSEGHTTTYDYDPADRITKITYPDGTIDTYIFDKLDLMSFQDRQNRTWHYDHDANRRSTAITDPLGQHTTFGYSGTDKLISLTDHKKNTTNWAYDVESRLTSKQYADGTSVAYRYENTTSRLSSVTDALAQVKSFTYAIDNRISNILYFNTVAPTPNVSFADDAYFPRTIAMSDGSGTTNYTYASPFTSGALQPQTECFTPIGASGCSYEIDHAYDALGRLSSRSVAGGGPERFGYDAIGRLVSHGSDLGLFTTSYLGQSRQVTKRQLVGSTLSTILSYLPNSGDRRLAGISNVGLSQAQFTNFQFTTTAENLITSATQSSDTGPVQPGPVAQSATFNNLNQLTSASGQGSSYDANGNLLSDGKRQYVWDAENRLVGISYPGQPGKATTFAYDGLGRRTTIASTSAGGSGAVTTTYIWCGARLCQSRDAGNSPKRSYYREGEFLPGAAPQSYYYGVDQIGSIRRVFSGPGTAQAYDYDPFGNALQSTASLTEFRYAGMFYNADSGLYLTQFRAYDPTVGRWLSRDSLGEVADPAGNLYRYVSGNPISLVDRYGLSCGNPLDRLLAAMAASPWLLPAIIGTELLGGGPEDPLADAAVLSEIAAAEGAEGVTSLYRAVGPAELEDIQATGAFQNLGSAEGKYFTTSGEAASSYARQAVNAFGDEPYTIVQTNVPNSVLNGMSPVSVDGGIPAYVVPNGSLPGLTPNLMNYSPIPGVP